MATASEDQLLAVLTDTLSTASGPRQQAELNLKQLQTSETFPISLANIASHTSISIPNRQTALSVLRRFVEKNWSGQDEDGEGGLVPISDPSKDHVRRVMLELATSGEDDRKIRSGARYVVLCVQHMREPAVRTLRCSPASICRIAQTSCNI